VFILQYYSIDEIIDSVNQTANQHVTHVTAHVLDEFGIFIIFSKVLLHCLKIYSQKDHIM
jgi:hypothetical protein